MDAKPP